MLNKDKRLFLLEGIQKKLEDIELELKDIGDQRQTKDLI